MFVIHTSRQIKQLYSKSAITTKVKWKAYRLTSGSNAALTEFTGAPWTSPSSLLVVIVSVCDCTIGTDAPIVWSTCNYGKILNMRKKWYDWHVLLLLLIRIRCISVLPISYNVLVSKCFCTVSSTQSPSKSRSLNHKTINESYFHLYGDQYPAIISDIGSW